MIREMPLTIIYRLICLGLAEGPDEDSAEHGWAKEVKGNSAVHSSYRYVY